MRMCVWCCCVIIAFSTAVVSASAAGDDEESLDRVLKRIPTITPDNSDLESLTFSAELPALFARAPVPIDFAWRKDGHARLLMTDPETAIPIYFAAQKKVMVYDCTSQSLLVADEAFPAFIFRVADGKVNFKYLIRAEKPDFDIDFRPFFTDASTEPTIEMRGDPLLLHYARLLHDGKMELTAIFDPKHRWPLRQFKINGVESDEPVLIVNKIVINEEPDARLFRFPSLRNVPDTLKIERFTWDRRAREFTLRLSRALVARLALHDTDYREKVANSPSAFLLRNVDWERAKRSDMINGPALKKLVAQD